MSQVRFGGNPDCREFTRFLYLRRIFLPRPARGRQISVQPKPYRPAMQHKLEEEMKMLKAEDIAACVLYTITQPKRCDVVTLQIRLHPESI